MNLRAYFHKKQEQKELPELEEFDPLPLYAVAKHVSYTNDSSIQAKNSPYRQLRTFVEEELPLLQQSYPDITSRIEDYVFSGPIAKGYLGAHRSGEFGVSASAGRLERMVDKLDGLSHDFPNTMSSLDGQIISYTSSPVSKDHMSEQFTRLGYAQMA